MNDRLKQIWDKMSKRLDLVATGALFFLLVMGLYLLYLENNYTPEEVGRPAPNVFDRKFETNREAAEPVVNEDVQEVEERWVNLNEDINQDPQVVRIIRYNMFDSKSVEEAAAAVSERYNEADALYSQGRYEQALNIVNEILVQEPAHPNALQLRDRLEREMEAEPTP